MVPQWDLIFWPHCTFGSKILCIAGKTLSFPYKKKRPKKKKPERHYNLQCIIAKLCLSYVVFFATWVKITQKGISLTFTGMDVVPSVSNLFEGNRLQHDVLF